MSLKEINKTDLVSISGGIDITDPNFSAEQFVATYLQGVSNEDLKNFIQHNVHVNVNFQVVHFPQLDVYNNNNNGNCQVAPL